MRATIIALTTAGHIGSLLELVLFILLGWKVFGAAVEG